MGAPKGHKRYGGRIKGTPNKATVNAREAIASFVDGNAHRLQEWLDRVAGGIQVPVLDDQGQPKLDAQGKKLMSFEVFPDPALAFRMVMDITEYHVPKLQRTDIHASLEAKGEMLVRVEYVPTEGES